MSGHAGACQPAVTEDANGNRYADGVRWCIVGLSSAGSCTWHRLRFADQRTPRVNVSIAQALDLDPEYGPWRPGISSRIPDDLRQHCTIFRPENVFTSVARADELHDLTGLDY